MYTTTIALGNTWSKTEAVLLALTGGNLGYLQIQKFVQAELILNSIWKCGSLSNVSSLLSSVMITAAASSARQMPPLSLISSFQGNHLKCSGYKWHFLSFVLNNSNGFSQMPWLTFTPFILQRKALLSPNGVSIRNYWYPHWVSIRKYLHSYWVLIRDYWHPSVQGPWHYWHPGYRVLIRNY